ncbi:uncharacterized protein METZ01_LOCUS362287, partial [marine metagenome]
LSIYSLMKPLKVIGDFLNIFAAKPF